MKVRIKRNPAIHLGCGLTEGQTGDVDSPLGRLLVSLGIADALPEPEPEVIHAIPDRPAIAEAKQPQIVPAAPRPKYTPATKAPVQHSHRKR